MSKLMSRLRNKLRLAFFVILFIFLISTSINVTAVNLNLTDFNGNFYDGFESGTLANWSLYGNGNDWEIQNDDPFNGTNYARARDTDGSSYLELNISTINFTNISISYYRKVQNFDANEYLATEWFNGTRYNLLENVSSGSGYIFAIFNLTDSANNNSKFTLRFACKNDHSSEKCAIDDVRMNGVSTIDTEKPYLINLSVSIINGSYYSGSVIEFNVSVFDNFGIGNVLIEFNGANYSATNISEVYSYRSRLGAGTYTYRWYVNDSSGNLNSTELQSYTILKGINSCTISITPTSPIVYSIQSTASASCNSTESQISLFRDNILVTNPEIITLAAGQYAYKTNSSESQNYTYAESASSYTVNKNQSIVSLKINDESSNVTINEGESINLSGSLIKGNNIIYLYKDNSLLISGFSPVSMFHKFENSGLFRIILNYAEDQNYSSSSEEFYVTVNKIITASKSIGSSDTGFGELKKGENIKRSAELSRSEGISRSQEKTGTAAETSTESRSQSPSIPPITGRAVSPQSGIIPSATGGFFNKLSGSFIGPIKKTGVNWILFLILILVILYIAKKTKEVGFRDLTFRTKDNMRKVFKEIPRLINKENQSKGDIKGVKVKEKKISLDDLKVFFPESYKDITEKGYLKKKETEIGDVQKYKKEIPVPELKKYFPETIGKAKPKKKIEGSVMLVSKFKKDEFMEGLEDYGIIETESYPIKEKLKPEISRDVKNELTPERKINKEEISKDKIINDLKEVFEVG